MTSLRTQLALKLCASEMRRLILSILIGGSTEMFFFVDGS